MTDDFSEENVEEHFEKKHRSSVAMYDTLVLFTHFEEEQPQPVPGLMAAGLDGLNLKGDSIWVGYEPHQNGAFYKSLVSANKHGLLRDLFEDMFE